MSRPVTLLNRLEVIGNVLLPSDYPADPAVLTWEGKTFTAAGFGSGSGPGEPGDYSENYALASSLPLADHNVSAPDVAPTSVVA